MTAAFALGRLAKGDSVRVRRVPSEEWCNALVAVASDSDPSSVALVLDGVVSTGDGGVIGYMLPLTIDYSRETVISLMGDSYEIEVLV